MQRCVVGFAKRSVVGFLGFCSWDVRVLGKLVGFEQRGRVCRKER